MEWAHAFSCAPFLSSNLRPPSSYFLRERSCFISFRFCLKVSLTPRPFFVNEHLIFGHRFPCFLLNFTAFMSVLHLIFEPSFGPLLNNDWNRFVEVKKC